VSPREDKLSRLGANVKGPKKRRDAGAWDWGADGTPR